MEVVDSVCESEGVCEVMCDVLPKQPECGEHMETHVSEEEAAHMAISAPTEKYTDPSDPAHDDGRTNTAPPKPCYSYR